jgi:hypothetical protein
MATCRRIRESLFGAKSALRGLALFLTAILLVGCQHMQPAELQPLYDAGVGYDAVTQLKQQKITQFEISQMAQAKQAGFSDAACVEVLQIYRSRQQTFDGGATIAGLLKAGASEDLAIKLARLNQLGIGAGELEAMRLAGLSDDILLAVAKNRAAGRPVLSGASLAGMKNLGMSASTLLQLAERGVPDSRAAEIMKMRRRGARDSQILRDFAGT